MEPPEDDDEDDFEFCFKTTEPSGAADAQITTTTEFDDLENDDDIDCGGGDGGELSELFQLSINNSKLSWKTLKINNFKLPQ